MKRSFFLLLCTFLVLPFLACENQATTIENAEIHQKANSVYDFTMADIDGKDVPLSAYKGKVLVFINTASKCGLTPQYADIQAFYEKYKSKGVVVLGFPANNFLSQEPGSNADIKGFCSTKYGVSFPMFSKISVKGKDIHPLYRYLTTKDLNGKVDAQVSWNFQKFVVDKEGKVVESFSPRTPVTDAEFLALIESLIR